MITNSVIVLPTGEARSRCAGRTDNISLCKLLSAVKDSAENRAKQNKKKINTDSREPGDMMKDQH